MSKTIDKLIDEIIELVLEDMDCHHEVNRDEDGTHMSVDYSLNDETKLKGKIEALLKPEITEEWIEEKAIELNNEILLANYKASYYNISKDFIRKLVKKRPTICKDWLPTAENINALPEPVRNYIADMQTNADPPSMVADNIIMKDTIKTLEKMLEEKPAIDDEFVEKWVKIIRPETPVSIRLAIKDMLKEAGVEVVEK